MNYETKNISKKTYDSIFNQIESDNKTKKNVNINSKILLIDGLNTFIRAFSANPAVNDDGSHIGGLIGFLKSLRYSIAKIKPTRCIIVFDGKNGSNKRRKIFSEYKGHRRIKQRFNRNVDWSTSPVDEEQSMRMQMSRLVKYLEQLPLTLISADNAEADDIIAYVCTNLLKDSNKVIMSTDKDFIQLVDELTHVWSPTKKILYDINKIFDEYGIYPKNFLTFKILNGDKSDNIAGIRGAGLKTIIKYIPKISENKKINIKDIMSFVEKSDKKIKLFENIKDNYLMLKRNYLLMQLSNVDISNYNKLKIQNVLHEKIPQLIKYKFSTMFVQDKLWGQIPDMDSWITEFIRLDRFGKLNGN